MPNYIHKPNFIKIGTAVSENTCDKKIDTDRQTDRRHSRFFYTTWKHNLATLGIIIIHSDL